MMTREIRLACSDWTHAATEHIYSLEYNADPDSDFRPPRSSCTVVAAPIALNVPTINFNLVLETATIFTREGELRSSKVLDVLTRLHVEASPDTLWLLLALMERIGERRAFDFEEIGRAESGAAGGAQPKNPHKEKALSKYREVRPTCKSDNAAYIAVVNWITTSHQDPPTIKTVRDWVKKSDNN